MNEIEKLYENANIEMKKCSECHNNMDCGFGRGCYPPFTAEKQLELVKWLAKKDCMYRLTYERDFLWCSQLEWQSSFCYEEFEESLANLVNTIWISLTAEEKQQIKEILK